MLYVCDRYRSPEEYDPEKDNMIPEDDWEAREERANDLDYRRQADYEMDYHDEDDEELNNDY